MITSRDILLECVGGPADGTVIGASSKEVSLQVAGGTHVYVRSQDETGPYWEYRGQAAA